MLFSSYALNIFAAESLHNKKTNPSSIKQYEKNLNLYGRNEASTASNRHKAAKAEAFLKTITDYSHLNHDESQALGKLFYKLGTFYTHVTHEPDLAINKMILADAFLTDKKDKAWNYNRLAYAYEQKFAAYKQESDKEHAIAYLNKVIADLYANAKTEEVAFAYCVKGLLLKDDKYDLLAELSFSIATEIYKSLTANKNDKDKNNTPGKCLL